MDEMWWGLVFLDNTSHFLSFQNWYVLLFFLKNMFMQALLFRQPTNFYRSFSNETADRLPGQPCAHWREKQESPGAQEKGRFATGALF